MSESKFMVQVYLLLYLQIITKTCLQTINNLLSKNLYNLLKIKVNKNFQNLLSFRPSLTIQTHTPTQKILPSFFMFELKKIFIFLYNQKLKEKNSSNMH